jgi:hypothetical protein
MKTEPVKNRIVCSNMETTYNYNSKNSEKLGQLQEFSNKYFVKISEFFGAPVKPDNSYTGHKSFCFCTESNQQVSTLSQRLCLALY